MNYLLMTKDYKFVSDNGLISNYKEGLRFITIKSAKKWKKYFENTFKVRLNIISLQVCRDESPFDFSGLYFKLQ